MTEQDWLSSTSPKEMLRLTNGRISRCCGCIWCDNGDGTVSMGKGQKCCPKCDNATPIEGYQQIGSNRKLRLFACACVRQSWHLFTDNLSRKVIETAENFADGIATKEETFRLASSCLTMARCLMPSWNASEEAEMVIELAQMHNNAILPTYANLFREVIGNPFRSVQTSFPCLECYGTGKVHVKEPEYKHVMIPRTEQCRFCNGSGKWESDPEWINERTKGIAQQMYDSRCFDAMPVLYDALVEAECDNEEILHHCLGQKRCWLCLRTKSDPLKDSCSVCGSITGPKPHATGWIPIQSAVEVQTSLHCPKCNKRGTRRHGMHFDHEYRCGECQFSWEPGTKVTINKPHQHTLGCWAIDAILEKS